jgi:hypothetical protein
MFPIAINETRPVTTSLQQLAAQAREENFVAKAPAAG